jgi:putative SOS response-associated peptidase YedK
VPPRAVRLFYLCRIIAMCVRYTLHKPDEALAAIAAALARKVSISPPTLSLPAVSASNGLPDWVTPRFNVTLTHIMPVVAASPDGPELRGMSWGLEPKDVRALPKERMLPNAKAETAATLPAFRQSVAARRCLVPANGFYEWQTMGKLKLPHLFTLRDEAPFAFAGIWEPPDEEDGAATPPSRSADVKTLDLPTFSILTTAPNALIAPIHNRMPVILTAAAMRRWLGREPLPEAEYRALTQPLPADRMQSRPVSRYVSNSRHEGPACHAPPEAPPPELALE